MPDPGKRNPLRSREDVVRAAIDMLQPLLPHLTASGSGLHLGETGAVYTARIAEMEGFSRALWAIVPMLAGGCDAVLPIWEIWKKGIIAGVDPDSPGYWGVCTDFDQRLVEMAVIGMGMAVAPERFFHALPAEAQANLFRWLDQINHLDMPKNNWTFFRVLVNLGFLVCGLPMDEERMEADLAMIEEHYDGGGWYFDYPDQREYYTMWAFGYYSLVYAYVMRDRDPVRSRTYAERAQRMAADFACWFDTRGEAVPYGRSLTYRFAQGSFYAALALAAPETPEMTYGMMKHLLLGNLRQWLRYPIFTRDGVLTIGYHYPNLLMAEGYNAPGSPYWALKAFICLMLPESHPFWQCEEEEPPGPPLSRQPHMRMLLSRSAAGDHVLAYTAGNHAEAHAHVDAKYEKFVYSTRFGFSVPRALTHLQAGAFDSMLAVSEDGIRYHARYGCESFTIGEDAVHAVWSPLPGVIVDTTCVPRGEWHLRIHRIHTERLILCAEGGFALGRDGEGTLTTAADNSSAVACAPWGLSGIRALAGYEAGRIVTPEPNTSLFFPRTVLPTLTAALEPGEHTLACLVLGSAAPDLNAFQNPPTEVLTLGTQYGSVL